MVRSNWDEIAAEEALPGIIRQVVHGERQSMIRYLYSPGAVFPVHAHPAEQVTVVVRGTITFTIDNVEAVFGPGGVAVIAANVPHGATVVGDEIVETLNAMSPRRDLPPTVHEQL